MLPSTVDVETKVVDHGSSHLNALQTAYTDAKLIFGRIRVHTDIHRHCGRFSAPPRTNTKQVHQSVCNLEFAPTRSDFPVHKVVATTTTSRDCKSA